MNNDQERIPAYLATARSVAKRAYELVNDVIEILSNGCTIEEKNKAYSKIIAAKEKLIFADSSLAIAKSCIRESKSRVDHIAKELEDLKKEKQE